MRGYVVNHGYVQGRIQYRGEVHYKNFGPDSALNRKAATEWAKTLKMQLKNGVAGLNDKALPFNKAVELVISLQKLSPTDSRRYILNTLASYFGSTPIDEIPPKSIKDWRSSRLKDTAKGKTTPIAENSVNREQGELSSLFGTIERAVKTGDLPPYKLPAENPCQYVKKSNDEVHKRTRVFTLPELTAIKAACMELGYGSLWNLAKFAITTTLRRKDLLREASNVTRSVEAKEGPQTGIRGVQAKTGRLYNIPFTVEQQSPSNGAGTFNLTKGQIRGQWAKVTEKAQVKDAQWRDLRRTGATFLEEAGYSTQLIKNVLGHASEAMTEKYLDMDVKKISPLVKHLDGLLSSL